MEACKSKPVVQLLVEDLRDTAMEVREQHIGLMLSALRLSLHAPPRLQVNDMRYGVGESPGQL